MELNLLAQGILALSAILVLAPLFAGLVNKLKALFTARVGAPLVQPYHELRRLFQNLPLNEPENFTNLRVIPTIGLKNGCEVLPFEKN